MLPESFSTLVMILDRLEQVLTEAGPGGSTSLEVEALVDGATQLVSETITDADRLLRMRETATAKAPVVRRVVGRKSYLS